MLHHGLQKRALTQTDSLAIRQESVEYSYGQLNDLANRTAHELLSRVNSQDSVIAILSSEPAAQLAVMFAVWKAGMTALILDPNEPEPRLKYVVDDSGADLVVAGEDWRALASRLSEKHMDLVLELRDPKTGGFEAPRKPSHPALILYTSGSTGQPKGIIRTHENMLLEARRDARCYGVSETDRISLMMPLNFGYGLKLSLTALLSGAALVSFKISSEGLAPFPDWLRDQKITLLNPPLSYFRSFLNTLTHDIDTNACRRVMVGGERLFKRDIDNFRQAFSRDCELIYTYGATETGSIAAHFIRHGTPISDPIPVGRPLDDVMVRIIDENGHDQAVGETGEIAVVSSNLPPGYWKDFDLTRQKYMASPDDDRKRMFLTGDVGSINENGLLYLYGREDTQLKIQGYRVDLTEIDTMLNNVEGVTHAVVVVDEGDSGVKRLTAFVSLSGKSALNLKELRRIAAVKLPRYMVPDKIAVVDKIPFTSRGKVDKLALVSMAREPLKTAGASPGGREK